MSNVALLDKTRKIGRMLHNNEGVKIAFPDVARVLEEILESQVAILSRKGKVLAPSGKAAGNGMEFLLPGHKMGECIDPVLNDRLLGVLSTKENVNLATLGIQAPANLRLVVCPVEMGGIRMGTILFCREGEEYDLDDIILCEYGLVVVGLEMLRAYNEELTEEARKNQEVKSAMSTLSYSELEAISHIFDEMDGIEGVLVASKIADRVGITRSVIVNALRKFESAGVIESRSSGMRGTYIKVVNELIFDEMRAFRASQEKE